MYRIYYIVIIGYCFIRYTQKKYKTIYNNKIVFTLWGIKGIFLILRVFGKNIIFLQHWCSLGDAYDIYIYISRKNTGVYQWRSQQKYLGIQAIGLLIETCERSEHGELLLKILKILWILGAPYGMPLVFVELNLVFCHQVRLNQVSVIKLTVSKYSCVCVSFVFIYILMYIRIDLC